MKLKFLRAFVLAIACLIVFLVITFIPSLINAKMSDFLQGFSGGMGVVALIAAIYYGTQYRKEQKAV